MRAAAAATWLVAIHAAVNAALLRRPPAAQRGGSGLVSVLVPARDEAERIGPCIAAALASRDVDLELVVLDDGSSDGTAAVARAAAGTDPRVRVLPGRPLPEGWLGKPHACAQLAGLARGEVLVFLDADVLLAPDGLARAVAQLETTDLDLVCPYPRQIVDALPTRLVQPLLQWSWLSFLPLRAAERSARPSLTAANGQLLVCRAEDYAWAGGHAAVRGAVLEDIELARAFKRAGLRPAVTAGHDLAVCAMYEAWPDLRDGYRKSLWAAFGSPAGAAAVTAVLLWLYVAPAVAVLVAALRGRRRAAWWAATAVGGGIAGRAVTAARTGGVVSDAVAQPASVAVFAWLVASSLRGRRRGNLTWRGRRLADAAGRSAGGRS